MAYSATLIPHLEKKDATLHATKEQTSWIGETDIDTRGNEDDNSVEREAHHFVEITHAISIITITADRLFSRIIHS